MTRAWSPGSRGRWRRVCRRPRRAANRFCCAWTTTPVAVSAQPRRKRKKSSPTNGVSRFGNSACLSSSPPNADLFVRGFGLLEGVVRRTHQRAGFHMLESYGFAADLELREFIGMDVAHDGQMIAGGPEILS